MEEEVNDFHREDYYLAQIACEVRRSYVKHPGRVKLKDFLIKFESRKPDTRPSLQESKQFWFSALGLDKDGKPKKG